ncbi:MAG: alpha/beta hydrolase-fold protein [Lysobacterales bacterium]
MLMRVLRSSPSILAAGIVVASTTATAMLPAPAHAASPAQPLAIGQTFTVDSKPLGETRRINVLLPRDYDAHPDAKFPVLYLLDGGIGEDFLHIAGLVAVETGDGTMAPTILVGIENTQRRRDLTGPTTDSRDLAIAPVVGKSATFREFLRGELMPAVRMRYRTNGKHAIIGESLAGLFVVETFLQQPTLFDTWIAVDASLWWNHDALVNAAARDLAAQASGSRTLYLACSRDGCPGGKDAEFPVPRFAAVLQAHAPKGLHWLLRRFPRETHATVFHPAAMDAFRTVFPAPAKIWE